MLCTLELLRKTIPISKPRMHNPEISGFDRSTGFFDANYLNRSLLSLLSWGRSMDVWTVGHGFSFDSMGREDVD